MSVVAPVRLSHAQARRLHLAAQGVLAKPTRKARKADVLAAIERMQLLQIDTIHVVARSPYLVLHSRLGAYPPKWLDELLAAGAIFECWAHEACFAPLSDYPLLRAHQAAREDHWMQRHARKLYAANRSAMDAMLAHIRANGPVKAADFERETPGGGGWWGWKDEKRWLEGWFALGELMIARRENFHRVYDLTERVLANAHGGDAEAARAFAADRRLDAVPEQRRAFLRRSLRALGISQARWIADYFRTGRRWRDADLDDAVAAGEVLRVEVAGWDAPGYVDSSHAELLNLAAAGRLRATHSCLLSPFDPVVWDRERASMLFDFDYRIECYTPAEKRKYGYFVLPILHAGALVGRLDAKAHRADGVFEVKDLHLEDGVRPDAALARGVAAAIRAAADWHATPVVEVRRCSPKAFLKELRAALA